MSKKTIKLMAIICMTVLILITSSTTAFALTNALDPGQVTPDISAVNATGIQSIGRKILGGIQVISAVLATIILAVLGLKYMMGSAEQKADYQKSMVPYIIGALLIFAAPQIAGMIFSILGQ